MISKHTKTIGIIAVILVVAAICAFIGTGYLLYAKDNELKTRLQEAANVEVQIQELSTLTKVAEESASERGVLESFVLTDEDIIDFLALIETIGREQGIELTTQSLDVIEIDATYEELRIAIDLIGPRNSVIHTIRIFENLPYQSYLTNITLAQTGTGREEEWNSTFNVYVTKEIES